MKKARILHQMAKLVITRVNLTCFIVILNSFPEQKLWNKGPITKHTNELILGASLCIVIMH